MANKSFYNTILSQVFSPCGEYLVVGDTYGVISVFNLREIIVPDKNAPKSDRRPKNTFVLQENVQVNSMLSLQTHLLASTVSEIVGYTWSQVKSSKDVQPAWKIEIPNVKKVYERIDINCMIYNEDNGYVYAGCGDNNIYVVDVNNGKIVNKMEGHTNYIHSVVNWGNDIVSGGEDGMVKVWDLRTKKCVHTIEPHQNSKLSRPDVGKWIGAVALTDDWLLCGGGPRLSLWHYKSLTVSTVFPIDDKGIHVAHIYQDRILAGGRSKTFYQMNVNGNMISEIPTSSISIYSAVFQDKPFKALCLSGSSPDIDICSNFNYTDLTLTLNSTDLIEGCG